MVNQSEQINEIMGALAKAQSEMTHAVKDSNNPYFKSTYADLAGVWEACRGPLSKNGLAVTQIVSQEGEKPILVTLLGHSSGQWIKSVMVLPIQKPGPQEIGSCITYCRRYALASIVGVYQDDDDAESAEGRGKTKSAEQKPSNGGSVSASQKDYLKKLSSQVEKVDPPYIKTVMNAIGVKSFEEMDNAQADRAIRSFNKRLQPKNKIEDFAEAVGGGV
jgi:hypothetical protein